MRPILHFSICVSLTLASHAPTAAATADEDFAVAASHYAAGRWQAAADEFRLFQQHYSQHPRAAEAEFYQAEALVQLGSLSEALTQYEHFLLQHDQHPLAPRALFRWGECSYRSGNPQASLRLLRQFCSQHPDHELNAYALPYLGRSLAAVDLPTDAQQTLQRALDRFPRGPLADECLLQLAILSFHQQQYEEALAQLDRLLQQFPDSPRRDRANYWRGAVLLVQHQYAEATEILEPLTQTSAANRAADPHSSSHSSSSYLLSLAYVATHRPADALRVLEPLPADEMTVEMQAQVALVRAIALAELGRPSEAIFPLRTALAGGPSGQTAARCRAKLIDCLLAAGQPEEATEVFTGWASDTQRSAALGTAAGKLAETAYADGHYQRAAELFAVLVDSPVAATEQARGLSGLAWSQLRLENAAEAERRFAQLIDRFPQDRRSPEGRLVLASLWDDRGQLDEALAAYARVIEETDDAHLVWTARFRTALLHERRGESRQALAQLDQILLDDANCEYLDQVRYLRGWILRTLGQPEPSAVEFQAVHDQYPLSPCWADATYRLAEQAYQAQQLDRAGGLLQEIRAAEPTAIASRLLPYVLYLQGRVAAAQSDWQQASTWMQRVTVEHPASEPATDARCWLAESLYQLEEYDAAWPHLQAATEATDQPSDVWRTLVPLRRAQIMAWRNEWPEALAAAQAVIDEQPDFRRRYEADYVVGRALMALARLDEARAAFQRVVDDPHGSASETAAMAQWMIGETYLHQRQYREAIRAYLKVELLYDYDHWRATALLQTAACYECLQEPAEARRIYQQLIDQFPQFEQQQTAARRLQALEQAEPRNASAPSATRS